MVALISTLPLSVQTVKKYIIQCVGRVSVLSGRFWNWIFFFFFFLAGSETVAAAQGRARKKPTDNK